MTWLLVFWIQYPDNFTIYETLSTEKQCVELVQVWDKRLRAVNSRIVVECRQGS